VRLRRTRLPIDNAARDGRYVLVQVGSSMALGRWNGSAWVYPVAGDMPVGFVPEFYYDPATLSLEDFGVVYA